MKRFLIVIQLLVCSSLFAVNVGPISAEQVKELDNVSYVNFESMASLYYQDDVQNFVLDFDQNRNYEIIVNDSVYNSLSNGLVLMTGFDLGDHSIVLRKKVGDGFTTIKKSFKYKETAPLIKHDAVVFGILIMILVLIFRSTELPFFKKFYNIIPALLLCYFVPAIFNSLNIISSDASNLYYVASRYLLPASLILLCLSIDLKGIKKLGTKAVMMFFAATIGIIIGGPIALYIVSFFAPDVLDGELWRGLSTVAGSWIGGGANQAAMKEIYGASDRLFSQMIIVDVVVANLFMTVLLFGTGHNKKLNKFFKADDSAIESLKDKMEEFQKKVSRVATFQSLLYLLGIVFFAVGLSHFLSSVITPGIESWVESIKETSPTISRLFSSFKSGFFWLIVIATIIGVSLSFTKARNFEGVGASKIGSIFLYILVTTLGMKMDIGEMMRNWQDFVYLIAIGSIWMAVHALFLFVVAKIIKAPFFYVAVGSQANVGGAASAPVVASAFSPSLAPVGVLLAVLGYAVGTFGAIFCTILLQSVSN